MSLKAKIEAVIYASEEPVTLAQLVGLLGHEAQAELDQMAAAQQRLALEASESAQEPGFETQIVEDTELAPEESPVRERATIDLPAEEPSASVEQPFGETSEEQPAAEEAAQDPAAGESERKTEAAAARREKERARRLREYFRELLDELVRDYAAEGRGLEVREVAGGFRLATKPEYHDAVRGFVKSLKPPLKLSLQALETLAVVAYKQPVTAPEVSEIRGVDSGGVLGSLMARKLVTTAGRKQVIGRPILYKTTKDFLLRFGLRDIGELPSIEEFEKMAGELAEQEEIPMTHDVTYERPHDDPRETSDSSPESVTGADLEEEKEATEPQADGDSSDVDTVPVDGRISGLPPRYDDAASDPSAQEAEIQKDQKESE